LLEVLGTGTCKLKIMLLQITLLKTVLWQRRVNQDIYKFSSFIFFAIFLHFPIAAIAFTIFKVMEIPLEIDFQLIALIISVTLAYINFPSEDDINHSIKLKVSDSFKAPMSFACASIFFSLLIVVML
jgi:hypothetical protein